MQINNFELIRPIMLFNAEWTKKDLVKIPGDQDCIQTGDFYSLQWQNFLVPVLDIKDVWGITWSPVPDDAWNKDTIKTHYKIIGKYTTSYFRIAVTVYNGQAGDSILFLFNQPKTIPELGLHAAVHVEIIEESQEGVRPTRSSAISQVLIRGYDVSAMDDGEAALAWIIRNTQVRFLGVKKQPMIRIRAQCDLIGGFHG